MSWKKLGSLLMLITIGFATPIRAEGPKLLLTIGVPAFGEKGERWIVFGGERQTFPVVLTNVSDKPIRLWENGNSWGHDNITFELTAEDGTKTSAHSNRSTWTFNGPWFYELAPHESAVIPIQFTSDYYWKGFPLGPPGFDKTVTMQARFNINVTKESVEHNVWTGFIESGKQKYRFLRDK